MQESRHAIRAEFTKHKQVTPGPQLEHLINEIYEAEHMLLHGFARGDLNPDTNRYGMLRMKSRRVCLVLCMISLILMVHFSFFLSFTEVKIEPQHLEGADSNNIQVEPVTPEMAEKVTKAPSVEVTKSNNKNDR